MWNAYLNRLGRGGVGDKQGYWEGKREENMQNLDLNNIKIEQDKLGSGHEGAR